MTIQVIGTTGGVFFADVSSIVSRPSSTVDYENVITHYLTLDDSIDITTGALKQFIYFFF